MTDKENEVITPTKDEDLETAAFDATVESLVPDPEPNPFSVEEGQEGDVEKDKEKDENLDKTAEDIAAAAGHFLGDMTEDQVLEKIQSIDGMEAALFEKVSQKVFGKFGEIGQSLKALQEREFRFDPEKLVKLKELDEGIATALAEDLKEALSGQSIDSDAIIKQLRTEVMSDLNPYVEQRLLAALVPNADELAKSDDFSKWFFKEAKQETRDIFQNWDDQKQMDGIKMAGAFKEFNAYVDAKQSNADTKKDALKKSVEGKKGDSKTPRARQHMTEDEAFAARTSESRA